MCHPVCPQTSPRHGLGDRTCEMRTNPLYLRGWLPRSSENRCCEAVWKEDGRANGAILSVSQCYFLQLWPAPLWLCS